MRCADRPSAALLGSDEQFFGDASERRTITELYDEHSDFRLGADAEDVDPVSMAYEIWRHARETVSRGRWGASRRAYGAGP